jgi:hypothetical protein
MFGLHSIPVILVLCVLQFSQIQGHMNLHNNNNNRITKHSQNGNIQYKGDGLRNPLYLSSLDLSSTTTSLPSDNKNTKVGVLLLNLGGPETLEVQIYFSLHNIYSDTVYYICVCDRMSKASCTICLQIQISFDYPRHSLYSRNQ